MESKILFFFFFIVIMILSTCKIYCFFLLCFLLLFLKDKDSQCIQVSLSDKSNSGELVVNVLPLVPLLFSFSQPHAVAEGLDNGT